MSNEEAINLIRIAQAEIEWDYPMEYAIAFDKAIEALERTRWRDAKTEPPEESGEYIVFCKSGYQNVMDYSARHKAFNVHDTEEEPFYRVEVTHWMPPHEPPKSAT